MDKNSESCFYFDLKERKVSLHGAKYIVYYNIFTQREEIIIFNNKHNHSEIAEKFSISGIIGAGFIDIINMKTFGQSETLKIKSRSEDNECFENFLNTYPQFKQ